MQGIDFPKTYNPQRRSMATEAHAFDVSPKEHKEIIEIYEKLREAQEAHRPRRQGRDSPQHRSPHHADLVSHQHGLEQSCRTGKRLTACLAIKIGGSGRSLDRKVSRARTGSSTTSFPGCARNTSCRLGLGTTPKTKLRANAQSTICSTPATTQARFC